ncbi:MULTISPECIES: hypothetical protein [Parabacteroides]|uniref:Uncharacterized protein n=1 Tax=Myoviridae sp. ctU4n16 TaxID=2826658 RepID=A0A8S5N5E1_9CAUD|nr:hypothetical protein [Parabacteroides goldsteinii]DAD89559.1 MAG TPA: hypothetical protein [Myoviridae sp. ctU4n16]
MNRQYFLSQNKEQPSHTLVTSHNILDRRMFKDNRYSTVSQAKMVNSILCSQRKLPTGVEQDTSGSVKVWLSSSLTKDDGILCKPLVLGGKLNKETSLQEISKKASDIGDQCCKKTWDAGQPKKKRWVGDNWEITPGMYNNKDCPSQKFNPFQVPIHCSYLTSNKIRNDYSLPDSNTVELTMWYHFGPFASGYIVTMTRTNCKESSQSTPMSHTGNIKIETTATPVSGDEYSSIHRDNPGIQPILNDTKGLTTGGDNSMKYDSYTKLAGEGARFQCVRDNIDKVSSSTIFWTKDERGDRINNPGIKFLNLCKIWNDSFGQKFNISNNELSGALKGDNTSGYPIKGDKIISINNNVVDPKIEL